MDQGNNQYYLPSADEGIGSADTSGAWQGRALLAEAEVRRLIDQGNERERQFVELQKAFHATLSYFHALTQQQGRDLESLRAGTEARSRLDRGEQLSGPPGGVLVRLPYMTRTLSVMFDAMNNYYARFDRRYPPKSAEVAREIDRQLKYREQPDREPSRSGQTFAAAIRPDWIRETEARHRRARFPDGAV